MATMNEAIERIDSVKPNVFSERDKYRWINRLEGMISTEVLDMETPVAYDVPADADRELLAPPPYDELYELYLAAMIDLYNKEYDHYNNSMLVFAERLEQFKTWHIRNNDPARARNFRNVMG